MDLQRLQKDLQNCACKHLKNYSTELNNLLQSVYANKIDLLEGHNMGSG